MEAVYQDRLEQLVEEGFHIETNRFINEGYNLFKTRAVEFIGFFFILTVISAVINLICQRIPYVGTFVPGLVNTVLMAGMYIAAHHHLRDSSEGFKDFFLSFEHFGPIVTTWIWETIISVLLGMLMVTPLLFLIPWGSLNFDGLGSEQWFMNNVPIIVEEFKGANPAVFILAGGLAFVFLLPVIYLGITWQYAYFFVVFTGASGWEALEASRRFVHKHFFSFLLFFIVVGLISIAGVLACGIGVIFTIPIGVCIQYMAFERLILSADLEIPDKEDLSDHLVDDNPVIY